MPPVMLGEDTAKTKILNSESQKLSLEFEAIGDLGVLTFSADLVAADVVDINVNGQTVQVTYGTSHAATMTAIANALIALSGVDYAKVHGATSRIISFKLADALSAVVVTTATVTSGGAGTAVLTYSLVTTKIEKGTPCILVGDELVAPANLFAHFGLADASVNFIGTSIHTAGRGATITLMVKGYMVILGQASGAVVAGPVDHDGYDSSTLYDKYKAGTSGNILGLALQDGIDGEVIKVLI